MTKLQKFKTNILSDDYLNFVESQKSVLETFKRNPYIYLSSFKMTTFEFHHFYDFLRVNYWIAIKSASIIVTPKDRYSEDFDNSMSNSIIYESLKRIGYIIDE